ncbi:MAG: type II toxin-antitoxin system RelE/ParE family toxin [Lachnospiraceae bacterium]|nr:type II toxin-antitoxin system RelE/ParE family toxin [uncultured Acetatifactor sp.]MCI9574071.1 type II toxin-antitoxin system RelE/ParE family toxin [Lachnospiraceae bacterium]
MDYKVVVTRDAEEDLERFIKYLVIEKGNMQAAENVLNDYDATIESLRHVAGSLKLCDSLRLKRLGYRRIHFLNQRYFMLYRIVDDVVFVDNIFHELQDYENKIY